MWGKSDKVASLAYLMIACTLSMLVVTMLQVLRSVIALCLLIYPHCFQGALHVLSFELTPYHLCTICQDACTPSLSLSFLSTPSP